MGIFVNEDGHFQAWFAVFACCCAAVGQDESRIEKQNCYASTSTETRLCNEQPLRHPILPNISAVSIANPGSDLGPTSGDKAQRTWSIPERPPSLKPLDLGEGSLLGRLSHRHKPSLTHSKRPSISAPHSFRRLDHTEAQRQSLVPLRLGPVVLRESPVPPEIETPAPPNRALTIDTHVCSDSRENLLVDGQRPESYRDDRESPFQRCQQRNSLVWPFPAQKVVEDASCNVEMIEKPTPTRPPISTRSSSSSLQRHDGETHASSVTPRSSHERLRPGRKRSQQSMRRHYAESADMELDKEIQELNTIVEERRAEATREDLTDQHIPAIAPAMQVRARSETLDAIGSALSRPYSARDFQSEPSQAPHTASDRPRPRRSPSSTSRASSRLSGWLSNIFPSSSQPNLQSNEPFYKCQPQPRALQRSYSEASVCTSVTELESPSLTVASSPTSKGHSRTHTGESRVTPISPSSGYGNGHYYFDQRKHKAPEEPWPVMNPTNEVGIAL